MADKRISQLVDRGTVANNDVVPIVVSGASTTNKATISSIQTFMQGNLDMGVTSVGLSMPSAFVVSNSPVTASGNISVTGAGTVSQYIRGDGSLADFPSGGGGGGSSVNYYLNGSVSQGTIGGIAYQEMNRTPILGAGTDFTIAADGYIASFITDAGDPALLEIPAGNWNFETYLQASSGGGTPSFYIELYKVNSGGTATLIASNSGSPELIAFGTTTTPYFSALAVPTTSLALTDRLALRYYVTHSGRTITLHTENATLCQIITTFTTGLTALNGLTAQVQNFATGTSGNDFGISSSVSTHTFNLPDASASARGVVTTGSQTFAGAKTFNSSVTASSLIRTGGTSSQFLKADGSVDSSTYLTTGSAGSTYVPYFGATSNVDLGVNTLTSSSVILNGSGSNSGIIHLESNAIHSLVNGYGSIASGTTNQFNLYQTTGAGVFRGAILSLNSITASATRTYTLPDADGTLALTSNLDGYVTLATTQTITGAKTFDTTTSDFLILNSTNASGGALTFRRNGTNVGHIGNSGVLGVGILDDLEVRSGIGKGLHLKTDGGKLTLSSGGSVTLDGALNGTSAVFSGSVTGSNAILTGVGGVLSRTGSTTTAVYGLFLNTSGGLYFGSEGSAGGTVITGNPAYFGAVSAVSGLGFSANNGNNVHLSLASTGAATFSSSVQAKSLKIENTGVPGFIYFNNTSAPASNYIALGSGANEFYFHVNGADRMIIKDAGNVGIGTASPNLSGGAAGSTILTISATSSGRNGVLELNGTRTNSTDISGYVRFFNNGAATPLADIRAIRGSSDTSGDLAFTTADTERVRINSSGDLIVKGSVANISLLGDGVQMHFSRNATNYIIANGGTGSTIRIISNTNGVELSNGATSWVAVSDENLKEMSEWKPFENSVQKILSLRAGTSRYKTDEEGTSRSFLIAQDVQEVLPEAVSEYEDGTLGLRYTEVIPLLVAAIQELKTEIDSLKNQMQ